MENKCPATERARLQNKCVRNEWGGVQKACFFSGMLTLLLFLQMIEPFLIFKIKIKGIKKMTSVCLMSVLL